METVTENLFFNICDSKCHVYVVACKSVSLAKLINPPALKTPHNYHAESCKTYIYSNEKCILISLYCLYAE